MDGSGKADGLWSGISLDRQQLKRSAGIREPFENFDRAGHFQYEYVASNLHAPHYDEGEWWRRDGFELEERKLELPPIIGLDQAGHGGSGAGEAVSFHSQALEHGKVKVGKGVVVGGVEGEVAAVFESATAEEDGHVTVVVGGGVAEVGGEDDLGVV